MLILILYHLESAIAITFHDVLWNFFWYAESRYIRPGVRFSSEWVDLRIWNVDHRSKGSQIGDKLPHTQGTNSAKAVHRVLISIHHCIVDHRYDWLCDLIHNVSMKHEMRRTLKSIIDTVGCNFADHEIFFYLWGPDVGPLGFAMDMFERRTPSNDALSCWGTLVQYSEDLGHFDTTWRPALFLSIMVAGLGALLTMAISPP